DRICVSTKEVFKILDSLNGYALEKLGIDHFGRKQCATVRAFLSESSARLRVKFFGVHYIPSITRKKFRKSMRTLQKLTERLILLEEVWLHLGSTTQTECFVEEPGLLAFPSCVQKLSVRIDIHGDTDVFVEALRTAWNRCLSIDVDGSLNDPLPLLSKVYEIFASDGELSPLLIKAAVPLDGPLRDTLEQFAVNRGFSQTTAGGACAYDKKRGSDWKIAIEYNDETLAIEIKR
ncbi:hypothetical protein AAVH_37971, partial [Aphelenchoides avenae]